MTNKSDSNDKKRVLILDDEVDLLSSLKIALGSKYEVITTETYVKAFEVLRNQNIDLMLLDIKMPVKNGLEVLSEVKKSFPSISVIMITGHGDEQDTLDALKLGASAFLKKPFDLKELFKTIDELICASEAQAINAPETSILIVDDDQDFINSLKKLFQSFHYKMHYATDSSQAEAVLRNAPIDILVIDLVLTNINGFDLVKKLKLIQSDFITIVITGFSDQEKAIDAIKYNVFDYIKKPFDISVLNNSILKGSEKILNTKKIRDKNKALSHANVEVQKQHYFINNIIRTISNILLVVDLEGNILLSNDTAQRVLGYSEDELKALSLNSLLNVKVNIKESLENSSLGSQVRFDDEEMIKKDKTTIPVFFTLSLMFGSLDQSQNFVFEAHDISYQKQAELELKQLAYFDPLTDLPNRACFEDFIHKQINLSNRKGLKFALLFMDLDHFKSINDHHGHIIGDKLLKEVASRLKAALRLEDFVARLGGDEFAVIITNIDTESSIGNIANKVNQAISAPYKINNAKLKIGNSIGISVYPLNGLSFEEILKSADIAMYEAKKSEHDSYQYYTQALHELHKKNLYIENEIAFALEKKQLSLAFQPIHYINKQAIFAVECLARWHHPDIGDIPPDLFISIAEAKGYMSDINLWLIETAFSNFSSLKQNLKLSINISPEQLRNSELFDILISKCKHYKIAHENIILELTEKTLLRSNKFSIELLKKIRSENFNLALDDFGTGYSSLNYIKIIPINILKIDKSFIDDISNNNPIGKIIIKSIINLCENLNIHVIAEGVETAEQLSYFQNSSANLIQGFYFSKPMEITKLASYISDLKQWPKNKSA